MSLDGFISRLCTCDGGLRAGGGETAAAGAAPATCGRSSGGEPGEAGVWGSASELSSQGRLGSRLNHWPCFSAMALTLSSGRWPSGGSSCEWLSQLWSAACVRSPLQPLPGDPGPSSPPDLALLRRRRRILAVRRWSSTSGLILRGLPRPLGWHMRDAVLGSSSGEKGAWAAEGEAGGGLTASGVSSTLGSLLRKVTGTSAIRTSPEAEGRKTRGRVLQKILQERKNWHLVECVAHPAALQVPPQGHHPGEVAPSICGGIGLVPTTWLSWNETTEAAFCGKTLGAVEKEKTV